jgi:hypothetical protein
MHMASVGGEGIKKLPNVLLTSYLSKNTIRFAFRAVIKYYTNIAFPRNVETVF